MAKAVCNIGVLFSLGGVRYAIFQLETGGSAALPGLCHIGNFVVDDSFDGYNAGSCRGRPGDAVE